MAEKTESVSFRLSASFAKELSERAAHNGESPGELARRLVIEALTDSQRARLTSQLDEVRASVGAVERSVSKLRGDIATSLAGMLKYLSPAIPEDARMTTKQIEDWIRQRLL